MGLVINWFKKLSTPDHRKAVRTRSPQLVAFYWDGSAPAPHSIRDISAAGLYLVTEEHWHTDTVVTLTLQRTDIPDAKTVPEGYITVLSKVIRQGEDGVGLAFITSPAHGGDRGETVARGSISRKTLARFVSHLRSDQGHAVLGYAAQRLEMTVLGPEGRFVNAWRARYEKTG